MEEFYKKYYLPLKKFVTGKINDERDVEELVHDILLAAYNSKPLFNGQSNEFTWICGIGKHKIIDFYRKKKLKTILFSTSPVWEEIADKAIGPEGQSIGNELKSEIKEILLGLTAGYGKILRLKYIDELSIKQISHNLKLSVKAVESKLIRAKKAFKKEWAIEHLAKK